MIPGYLKWGVGLAAVAGVAFVLAVPQWVAPSAAGVQLGPPPTSMILFPQGQQVEPVSQVAPAPLPPVAESGQLAKAVYKNVQVLGDVDQAEFMRLQEAITQWVSPKQGCGFCHAGNDFASDAKAAEDRGPADAVDDADDQRRLVQPRRAVRRHLLYLPPRPADPGRDLVSAGTQAAQAATSRSRSPITRRPTRSANSSPMPVGRCSTSATRTSPPSRSRRCRTIRCTASSW